MVPGLEVLYANKGSNMLDADQAIAIYLAKASSTPGDDTLTVLSEQYNITMKAVRDVWNLRTWVWCTMPYWPHADRARRDRHLLGQGLALGARQLNLGAVEAVQYHHEGGA